MYHLKMVFLNMDFHGEVLLVPRPTPTLEDHPLLAVRDCLFNLFAATPHIGGRSSIRNHTKMALYRNTHTATPVLKSTILVSPLCWDVATRHCLMDFRPFKTA